MEELAQNSDFGLKVAIVLITRWWRGSIDLEGYCAALARQGHSPCLVCLGNDAGPADFPVIETTRETLDEPGFWRELGLDVAIVFNWLRSAKLISALREAGTRAVLRADHDGRASVRVFPGAAWPITLNPAQNPLHILRHTRHWLRRRVSLYREEDAELLATLEAADAVAIESREAAAKLEAILRFYGQEALARKIGVVPHSVSDPFFTVEPGPLKRPQRIFCGGRWDDPQKDARLLAATLGRVLERHPEAECVIAGSGTDHPAFAGLANVSRVCIAGRIPHREIPARLAECQFLLSSSRWETQPVGTLEALCMGASVVAPPLPGFIALAAGGECGTLSSRRNAASLAEAASKELENWSQGARNPREIAARWRARVSNDAVVAALLAL